MELPRVKGPGGPLPDGDPRFSSGTFYRCRYGEYLIGMNCTDEEAYTLEVPGRSGTARDLISGERVDLSGGVRVSPDSTVILHLGS